MFLSRPPSHPQLRGLIARFWLFRGEPGAHGYERILPRGEPQIVVNLLADRFCVGGPAAANTTSGAVVEGPFDRSFILGTIEQRAVAGVSFHPGGLGSWVHTPDLVCDRIDLSELVAGDLRDRLLSGGSDASVLDRLEAVLVASRRWGPDPRVTAAAQALERGAPVASLIDELGMGPRQFRRFFGARMGLLPKRYARVRRFQRALPLVRAHRDLGEVAFGLGFSDQAHLSREFRSFTGLAPSQYQSRPSPSLNHVAEALNSEVIDEFVGAVRE